MSNTFFLVCSRISRTLRALPARTCAVLVIGLFLTRPPLISAQNTTDIPSVQSAASGALSDLVKRYTPPSGAAWNVTLHYSVQEQNAVQAEVTTKLLGPSMIRRERDRNGEASTAIFNGDDGHMTKGESDHIIPLWIVRSSAPSEFPFPSLAMRLADPQTRIELIHDLNGADANLTHLRISRVNADGTPLTRPSEAKVYESDVYIDPEHDLLVKEKHWVFSPSNMTNRAQENVEYSDYRNVEGFNVPYRITKRLGGVVLSDAILQQIDLHAAHTAAEF